MANHPSQKLSEAKRAQLFRLAGAEFAEQGFARASLNRIIAAMGMSKSSFYHYFENKSDLFRQTLAHALGPLIDPLQSFDPSALTAETYWPFLEAMGREQTRIVSRSPEIAAVGKMFYRSLDTPQERELTSDLLEVVSGWITAMIRRGQELGLVRTDLPETLLFDALMGLGMAIDRWMVTNWEMLSTERRVALSEMTFDLFRRMMVPPAVAPGEA